MVLTVALPADRFKNEPERLPGQGGSLQGECQVKAHRATLPHAGVTVLRPQPATLHRGISARLRLVIRGEFAGGVDAARRPTLI